MFVRLLFMLIAVFSLTACSTSVATDIPPETTKFVEFASPTPAQISTDTLTPTALPSATQTPTPTLTPTSTPLPEELKEDILQAYKVLLFIQIDANLINETATRVKSGELAGYDSLGAVIAIAALVQALEEVITETTPPEMLQVQWDEGLVIHNQTKDILKQWFNKDIDSSVVLEEIKGPLTDIEKILSSVDEELSKIYGFKPDELKKARDDALASVSEIFGTPTPSP